MIIYSNENNTSALKLLICAKLAKETVQLRIGSVADNTALSLKQLPVLEVSPELKFFSSNAACLFLFPSANLNDKLQSSQWLEWEATKLLPNIANLGTSKSSKEVVTRLTNLVEELNAALKGKDFLLGKTLSATDVCIWCTLFLVSSDANLAKQYLNNTANIKQWYEKISGIKEVQESLKEYPVKSTDICQALNAASISGGYLVPSQSSATTNETSNSPATGASPEQKPEVAVTPEELAFAQEAWTNGGKKLAKSLPDEKIVLPKEGYKNILITSALPYVNNVPHLGNIIGCVLSADVFARYCRLCAYNTLFICGTDEYGTATETKALEERITPREICDKYFEIHNAVYRWFGIGFDYFGRTTTPEQTEIAQDMFHTLHKNGFVDTQTVEQLLCEKCNRFLADRFVEGGCPHPGCGYEDARGDQCDGCGKLINAPELINPRCKLCSTKPVLRTSSHFFLDLPLLEPLLQVWVSASESGWSNSAQQITRSWLKTGLRSRCITRDLDWGVPVPMKGFEKKVFYVWFDAPIGYISITKRYTAQYEQWWKPDPKHNVTLYQFMAKDNVPFHSVVFPATLLGIGQKHVMVKHIMATEYLNYEDGKFSKSRGVGVFGTDAQDTGIPSDIFRFYLLSIRPEGQDSNFSWLDMATRNNSELLNNLGNFVNRATVFCANSFNGTIPQMSLEAGDYNLLALVNREIKSYMESLELSKQRDALRHVLNISRHGNQFMQSQQPWVLLKGTDDAKTRAGTVVGLSCNISCLLGVLLSPFMPQTARTLLGQLGTNLDVVGKLNLEYPCFRMLLSPGHKIGSPSPLFDKIELAKVEELKKKYAGRQSPPKEVIKVDGLSAQELDALILKQGEKVRQLKSSGAEKAVWQPEVEVLLALKKKLAQGPTAVKKEAGGQSAAEIEAEIAKQGEKVRQLKSSGVEKAVWQPEVELLLALKKKLTQAPAAVKQEAGVQTVAEIEAEIAKQGEKVRQLKTSKADKSVWQPEVDVLLGLKKKLTQAQQVKQEGGDAKSSDVKSIAELEAEIAKQGEKVRQLKTSGAEKAVWQPEVNTLLALKNSLTKLNPPAAAESSSTDSKKAKKAAKKN